MDDERRRNSIKIAFIKPKYLDNTIITTTTTAAATIGHSYEMLGEV